MKNNVTVIKNFVRETLLSSLIIFKVLKFKIVEYKTSIIRTILLSNSTKFATTIRTIFLRKKVARNLKL